jgi:hypothetical protein
MIRDGQGKHRRATLQDLSCKGFSVSTQRNANNEVARKFNQGTGSLPSYVKHVRDSLAKLPGAKRPCTITLRYNGNDKVREFYFNPCEEVVDARVIAVTAKTEVLVRVDLKDRAEVIVFSQDGLFLNRFTFNRQDVKKRKDLIAVDDAGRIIEEDYERIKEDYSYLLWEQMTSPETSTILAAESKQAKD